MSIEERACLFGLTILAVFKQLQILTTYLYVHILTPEIKDVTIKPKVKVRPHHLQIIKNAHWIAVEFGHR
ncbi:hypothetical protein BDF21DRAFT_409872, partial [Thamnidium elegans]